MVVWCGAVSKMVPDMWVCGRGGNGMFHHPLWITQSDCRQKCGAIRCSFVRSLLRMSRGRARPICWLALLRR